MDDRLVAQVVSEEALRSRVEGARQPTDFDDEAAAKAEAELGRDPAGVEGDWKGLEGQGWGPRFFLTFNFFSCEFQSLCNIVLGLGVLRNART